MNKAVAFFLFLLISTAPLSAQISEGGIPWSQSLKQLKSTAAVPVFSLRSPDRSALFEEDKLHPTPYRYAVFEDVNLDLKVNGRKDTLPGQAGTIWRLSFESDSAFSIQVIFSKFIIPAGASLFVYNKSLTQIAGAFTQQNMQDDSTLVVADIIGNNAIVEYFEPPGAGFPGKVVIGAVAKGYKNIYQLKSGSAYININCSEGRELQLSKHAVCKITFRSGTSSYLCTGSMINNVRQDGTPYFLTASHCINDSAEAASMVAYFNYENEGCDGNALIPRTLSGATLLSTSPASDYALLLLKKTPTAIYQPFYAGWDVSDSATSNVTGIHHPEGLTKKLSLDNDTIVSNPIKIQWEGNSTSPIASHWQVNFDEGLTGGGSSGSPLFNKKHEIIGQLHGGDNTYDLYGKLSYSWAHTSGKFPILKQFLDPDNTGKYELNGYSPPGNPPDAFIDIPVSKVCLGAPIQLTDYSAFAPYSRTWIITPSTFAYDQGTSSSSADPVIKFLQMGTYSVKLVISKASGTDSMKVSNAFQAGDVIDVGVRSSPAGESCLCTFNHFLAWAGGASTYHWSLLPGSDDKVQLSHNDGDTVLIRPVPGLQADSTIILNIMVTGTQGTCADTAILSYSLTRPENDNVKNAVLLQYGKSSIFSNHCASVETGEPVPPHVSCTTQDSWCDEYGTGENIVEHSVWFKFIAGDLGYISISSSGIDDELALYEADSYPDILNQNYTLLAANDDRSSTDYNPMIRSQKVTTGKTYWLQVDGSGGGSEGNFSLQLTGLTVTGMDQEKENVLVVYPQPAKDLVFIKGYIPSPFPVHLSVFSATGKLVYDDKVLPDGGILRINVSSWEKGVYIARIESGQTVFMTRIIKY
jgi:hypothetical protein